MKKLGLKGDKFTILYGVISRHSGKDRQHDLTEEQWKQIPEALQHPLLISKYYEDEEKKHQKGYRIYVPITKEDGSIVAVGAEVKSIGRDIEMNAIDTVFGRDKVSETHEDIIYTDTKNPLELQALLNGHNPHQYPA